MWDSVVSTGSTTESSIFCASAREYFLAVFEPAKTGYNVYFPDLPGCVSYGEDFEKTQSQAAEALSLHLYGMEKDGDPIPAPSKTPQIDPETAAGYLVSPVTVFPDLVRNELDNRAVKTNLTIPAWLKEIAEAKGVNYSKIFQTALMDYLGIKQSHK
jgi:predicted RNase H-like HicB family nuclease